MATESFFYQTHDEAIAKARELRETPGVKVRIHVRKSRNAWSKNYEVTANNDVDVDQQNRDRQRYLESQEKWRRDHYGH